MSCSYAKSKDKKKKYNIFWEMGKKRAEKKSRCQRQQNGWVNEWMSKWMTEWMNCWLHESVGGSVDGCRTTREFSFFVPLISILLSITSRLPYHSPLRFMRFVSIRQKTKICNKEYSTGKKMQRTSQIHLCLWREMVEIMSSSWRLFQKKWWKNDE